MKNINLNSLLFKRTFNIFNDIIKKIVMLKIRLMSIKKYYISFNYF